MPPSAPHHTTILGAGLTGLSTAYFLAQRQAALGGRRGAITLLDRAERVGGWVDSGRYRVEMPRGAGTIGKGKGKEREPEDVDEWRDEKGGVVGAVHQGRGKGSEREQEAGREDALEVVLESGPRSIRPRGGIGAARMLKLVRMRAGSSMQGQKLCDLEMQPAIIPVSKTHPAATVRFVLDTRTHQLVQLPSSLRTLLFPRARHRITSALLPAVLREPFRRGAALPLEDTAGHGDTSVDALVATRLGPDLALLVSAMVHGIYAADTRRLSVRSAFPALWDAVAARGSVVRGLIFGTGAKTGYAAWRAAEEKRLWAELGPLGKEREAWSLYGLRGGLGALTARLEDEVRRAGVDVRLGRAGEVSALDRDSEGNVVVRLAGDNSPPLVASRVISTLPPARLAPLLPAHLPIPHLAHNPATTVGVVNLVFPLPPARVHPAGFGYLVPRGASDAETRETNPQGVLGVVFDSTAVEGLEDPAAAARVTKLTVMLGGPHWSSYDPGKAPPTTSELPALALAHLRTVFPALPDPVLVRAHIHTDCIPTYLPGHGARVREMHDAARDPHGWAGRLGLAGNGYGGVGVNDCVESAWEVVNGWEGAVAPAVGGEDMDASWTGLERWQDWD